jgi:hypothetical protein
MVAHPADPINRYSRDVRHLAMRVNIRLSSIRRRPLPGLSAVARRPPSLFERRRGEGGRDHLIVAHYEVVGRVFFKSDPSRKGRSIGCLRSRDRMRAKD